MSEPHLILHVKGTAEETTTLPEQAVKAAIAEGKLTRSQLIWSAPDHAWKQAHELPHLWPTPTPRPVPVPVAQPAPKVQAQPQAAVQPQVAAVQPKKWKKNYRVEGEHHFNPFKWISLVLGLFLAAVIGYNYFLVQSPLSANLSQTPYAHVSVYAHLGGFFQKDALQIHLLDTKSLNKSNFADFLVALAHSTPQEDEVFKRISLSTGIQGQYTLSGSAWKEFGDMQQASEIQRRNFLLDQLGDATGGPVLFLKASMTPEAQETARTKAWDAFVVTLIHS